MFSPWTMEGPLDYVLLRAPVEPEPAWTPGQQQELSEKQGEGRGYMEGDWTGHWRLELFISATCLLHFCWGIWKKKRKKKCHAILLLFSGYV